MILKKNKNYVRNLSICIKMGSLCHDNIFVNAFKQKIINIFSQQQVSPNPKIKQEQTFKSYLEWITRKTRKMSGFVLGYGDNPHHKY